MPPDFVLDRWTADGEGNVIVVMLCKQYPGQIFFFFNGLRDDMTQAALLV